MLVNCDEGGIVQVPAGRWGVLGRRLAWALGAVAGLGLAGQALASGGSPLPPTVGWLAPTGGASFTTGTPATLIAAASDADGTIATVDFLVNGTFAASGVNAGDGTFSAVWIPSSAGTFSVTAVATDDGGNATASAGLGLSASTPPAPAARCTTTAQGNQLKSALLSAISCNQFKLQFGPSYSCATPNPPACAGNIVSSVIPLAHGVNNPPAAAVNITVAGSKKQYECQNELAKGLANYIGEKVYQLTQGMTPAQAETQAQTLLVPITTKCTGVTVRQDASGVVLPSLGSPCGSLIGAVGSTLDPAAMTTCLRTTGNTFLAPIANYLSPTVSLLSPTSGASFQAPVSLLLTASASDPDGTIANVTFQGDNGVVLGLGTPSGGSYAFTWTGVPAGAHAVTAVATDAEGLVMASAPAVVSVTPPPPAIPPTAAIIAPATGATYGAPASIPIDVAASDSDGYVVSVDYYADTTYLGSGLDMGDGTFNFVWSAINGGTFQVFAVATDDDGLTVTTAPTTVYVTSVPLSVAITSPANGLSMTAPSTLPIVVATTGDEVAAVEIYVDGVLLGLAASQGNDVYGLDWLSPTAGTHQLSSVVIDMDGDSVASTPVTVTFFAAGVPPTVSITAPSGNASLVAGTAVLLGANASDGGGGVIAGVDFLVDGASVGQGVFAGNGAYSAVWVPSVAGTFTLTAVATDDDDMTATSSGATLTVGAAPTPAARCTTSQQGTQFKTTVKLAITCNQNKLQIPGYVCSVPVPPPCSGTVTTQAASLSHGPNSPPASPVNTAVGAMKSQFDCQAEISKALYNYMGDKINLLTLGQTPAQAEAQASTWFAPIPTKCTNVLVKQDVSGVVLPAVGAACQAYVGGVGATVNEPAMTACLHSAADALLTPIAKYAFPTASVTAPTTGSSYSAPLDLFLSATAADSDGTVSQVSFRDNGALLGLGTLSGGTYSFTWSQVPSGAHAITAEATDSNGLVTASTPVVVGVAAPPPNAPPDVSIASPADGATAFAPATWDLLAAVNDTDGSILSVTFFANGISLGAGAPIGGGSYGLTWSAPLGGTFTLTAVAVDDHYNSTTSAPVVVDVQSPPSVQLTAPSAGVNYPAGASLVLGATASDADGTLASVQFFIDGVYAADGVGTGGTYTATLATIANGSHDVVAVATDDDGLSVSTAPVSFTVSTPPTVSLTGPAAGAAYTTNDGVTIVAATTPGSGALASVDFYVDGALLGPGVHAGNGVYSRVWNAPTAGVHSLTAVAIDGGGLTGTSAPVAISVSTYVAPVLCTTAEASTLKTVLTAANNCTYLRHVYGLGYACSVGAPPACAPTSITDVMGLAWGPNYPPIAKVTNTSQGVQAQLSCQSEIGKATLNYVSTVVQNLVSSTPSTPAQAQALGAAAFGTIATKCTNVTVKQDATGVILPAVGAACQAYVGNPGSVVNVAGLQTCLNQAALPWTKNLSYIRPTISFGTPEDGQTFIYPMGVPMVLRTGDTDGTIAQVSILADGVSIGNAAQAPGGIFTFTWAAPGGAHALSAKAQDNDGMSTTTPPLVINMASAPSGTAPTVAIVNPTASDAFEAPASIPVDILASDADGSVAQVDLYANGSFVGTALSMGAGLFTVTWSGASAGTHNLTAIATDDEGNRQASTVVRARIDNAFTTARCTSTSDADDVAQALADALAQNEAVLLGTPSGTLTAPPSCSESLVFDTVRLVYGPNDPPTGAVVLAAPGMTSAHTCQASIGQAVTAYVTAKMSALVTGASEATAQSAASPSLDALIADCDGVTVTADAGGVVLPQVGTQCAAVVGAAGTLVDGVALRECLSSLLDVWTNRAGPSPQPLRPNILFILTDDQRQDMTGPIHNITSGDLMWRTRQQIAGQGIEFPNAYLTTPLCGPSRASILTGQYSNHHGVYRNASPFGANEFVETSTVALWLQSVGYRTALFGKYMNGYDTRWTTPSTPHIPPGWTTWSAMKSPGYYDYFLVENGVAVKYNAAPSDYGTDVLRERAKTFMQGSVAAGQPFFAWVGFYAPHAPFTPAPRHIGLFANIPPWRPASFNEVDVSDKPAWVQAWNSMPPALIATNDKDRMDALESLLAVDEAIGGEPQYGITGLLEEVSNLGIERDTIVIYMGDNGYAWGEHRMTQKTRVYEEQIRPPFMVKYPRLVPQPRVDKSIVANIDIAPTLSELAGVTPPDPVDGRSFVRVLDGTESAWRTHILIQGYNSPVGSEYAAVTDGVRKYVECEPGDREYYDLTIDPLEMDSAHNAPQNATITATMAGQLRKIRPTWPADVP